MAKYFIDTEFHEYHKQQSCCGIKIRKPIPTIDLISIGIYAEDGREYYAISKDFNIEDAWNSFQLKEWTANPIGKQEYIKEYWLRENVLKPIYWDLCVKDDIWVAHGIYSIGYSEFKYLINKYGKTNKEIAKEVIEFTSKHLLDNSLTDNQGKAIEQIEADATPKEFYGYYSDYDWVVFCQMFGKMINLPDRFPMYCIDLKQEFDRIQEFHIDRYKAGSLKLFSNYPKLENEHNALADAKWNYELYKFLGSL